jgi:outer membrane protein insertion porin family
LNADKELLRRFYLKSGYLDFRLVSAVAELSPNQDAFYLTFTVDEGSRYSVRDVKVKSAFKDVDVTEMFDHIKLEKGDWYNSQAVDKSSEEIQTTLNNKGLPFVDVDPALNQDRKTHTVDITFDIKEGQRVFVEAIDITGNIRTLDSVIRREFKFGEGDALNAAKLRRTKQKLQNLGFFEKADITTEQGSAPDRAKVKVDVSEQSTGELSFGGGYSTTDQLIGDIRLRERNLLGRGQDVKVAATLSTRRTEFDFGFTEPYFMDRNVAAGVDLFHITRDNRRESSYDEKRTGGALRAKYNINEALSQEVRYGLREVEIRNVAVDASTYIKQQEGTTTTSEVSQTLLYDKRDNKFTPSNGYFAKVTTDVAGLGGDNRYFRPSLGAGYYYPLGENWILGLSGEAGHIFSFAKTAGGSCNTRAGCGGTTIGVTAAL